MHLDSIKISRFRSFDKCSTVKFQKDLTVLLGENNGGKSNIVDAIRLATLPLNGRRERYAEDDDVRRGAAPTSFEIESTFKGLSQTLKGLLISAVPDPTNDEAVFGIRYEASAGARRGKFSSWAGKFGVGEPEAGSSDLIRHVYLPPLRDAQKVLGSSDGARVMALFRHFLAEEDKLAFVQGLKRPNDQKDVLKSINADIGNALNLLTGGIRPQIATLGFGNEDLLDIARDLRFKLADEGLTPEDIRSSGLGYANLLYMATIAVELIKAKEADLTLFLVEEPEAHLHPQLQMLVLQYLLEKARDSLTAKPTPGHPEGRIQIIVTTHSPNLTAWVSPKHLVIVRSQQQESHPSTVSVPIAELHIDSKQLKKIQRYLDVTRSALFFGRRAILVEGIAEALLLPSIAEHVVLKSDKEGLRRFKAALITPIEGVDFAPYVEVLLQKSTEGARVVDRLIIITDGDPSVPGNRKKELEEQAAGYGTEEGALTVCVNQYTLEHEIFAGNEALLKNAFAKLHPKSIASWESNIESRSEAQRPDAFLELIKEKRTRKGDLAQAIAELIEEGEAFQVPEYLAKAIQEAAKP